MRRFLVLLLAATGCGDDGAHQLPDAPLPPDAASDAAPDTPVTITITQDGEPRSGIEVYFLNPDDSLVSKTTTDADGVASAIVLPGASVTAIDPFAQLPSGGSQPRRELRTIVGVQPGDALELSERWSRDYSSVQVNLPLAAGANTYKIDSTCSYSAEHGGAGSATPPSYTHYLEDCGGTADFVVEAFSSGTPVGWFSRDDVEVEDGGTLDFTSATYQTLPEVTVTFENVPATFDGLEYGTSLWNARGALWELYYYNETAVKNGTGVATFARPSIAGTRAITTVYPWGDSPWTYHELMYWGAPEATTYDLDGAPLREFTDAPSYDPVTRTLAWPTAATGATPDFSVASIYVEQADEPYDLYEWYVVAPYGTSHVLPKLPDEAFPFAADASSFVDVWNVANVKVPGGYDAARGRVFAIDDVEELATGPSGRISIAEFRFAKAHTQAGKAELHRAATAKASERTRRAADRR